MNQTNPEITEKANELYWLNKLKNIRAGTFFVADNSNYAKDSTEVMVSIEEDLVKLLETRSKGNELSRYVILLTALKLLFHAYRKESPFVFSTLPGAAGKEQEGAYCFHAPFQEEDTLIACLKRVQQELFQVQDHAEVDMAHILHKFKNLHSGLAGHLFNVGMTIGGMNVSSLADARVDTHFHFDLSGDTAQLAVKVAEPESETFLSNLARHLLLVIGQLLNDAHSPLKDLSLIAASEHIPLETNAQGPSQPVPHSLVALFEQQAIQSPEATAVVFEDIALTYTELNQHANQLARLLVNEHQVAVGDKVGVLFSRSHRNIICMMAIMKSGATYVPLDDQMPLSRIEHIVDVTQPKVIFTEDIVAARCEYQHPELINYDQLDLSGQPAQNLDTAFDLELPAYMIHTSGSTGNPKGILQTHSTLANLVQWQEAHTDIGRKRKFLQYASFHFDVSLQDFSYILCTGGELHICSEDIRLDFEALLQYVISNELDAIYLPFSVFSNFFQINELAAFEGHHLKHLITGGEQVLIGDGIREFLLKYPEVQLHNQYGPSETHVVTAHTISGNDDLIPRHLPIGKPVSNTRIYIVDEQNRLVPEGVLGEVYASGANLAQGYLNADEGNASRFATVSIQGRPGEWVYKTGDKARWLPGGIIEYLGRSDDQVKVQGYRIELGEIITAMLQYPAVTEAVVITAEKNERTYLIGYLISEEEQDVNELRAFLSQRLPAYMVPAHLVQIGSFPLTANGKLDKKRLLATTEFANPNKAQYKAPENEMEERVVDIWAEELQLKQLGTADNFFSVGGDSVLAIRVVSLINKAFGAHIEVKDIYQAPTIAQLAGRIEQSISMERDSGVLQQVRAEIDSFKRTAEGDERQSKHLPSDYEDIFPVSAIQYGMIYHNLLAQGSAIYHNQSTVSFIDEAFDFELFKRALFMMVQKHAMMRTSFHFSTFPEPVQIVHRAAESEVRITFENLTELSKVAQSAHIQDFMDADRNNPFDVTISGLYRMVIFQLSEKEYTMLWVFHHAILDGWSEASFKTELNNTYRTLKEDERFELTPLGLTYKDYVINQRVYQQRKEVAEYWERQFEDFEKTPLPLSKTVGVDTDHTLRSRSLRIPEALVQQLGEFGRDNTLAPKDIYLAAFAYLLSLITAKKKVTLGLVANGRPEQEDGDKVIGCFLNTVPFTVDVAQYDTWQQLIAGVKVLYHEIKSYDKLSLQEISRINQAVTQRTSDSTNPLFDILFDYVDFHIYNNLQENGQSADDEFVDRNDQLNTFFNTQVIKERGVISVAFGYLNELYGDKEIDRIYGYYQRILEAMVTDQTARINSDQVIGQEEVKRLLTASKCDLMTDYVSQDNTLVALFEQQVAASPDAVAVVYEGEQLTYGELNQRVNQLSQYISQHHEVGSGDYIGVLMGRSQWAVVGILGVLKAGATYLPLDVALPKSRIEYILEDTQLNLLITDQEIEEDFPEIEVIQVGQVMASAPEAPSENPALKASSDDNAYIIYTSGSTGNPKGVEVSHRNASDLLLIAAETLSFSEKDNWLQFHSITFDLSVWEIFGALTTGGKVVIIAEEARKDPRSISSLIVQEQITILHHVPSMFYLLANQFIDNAMDLSHVRIAIFGGEALNPKYLKEFQGVYPNVKLYNMYGITETTVYTTFKLLEKADFEKDTSNIGKTLPGAGVYLLNEEAKLVPEGVMGELVVAGTGVTRGYLNKEVLTNEKFIQDPYHKDGLIYRSGDLGILLENGDIQYISRKDDQVKIRGYRIELQDIESNLVQYEQITRCVVLVSHDKNSAPAIHAYYTGPETIERETFIQFLNDKLPAYMMPAHFIKVDEIPKTFNDKVDKKALLRIQPEALDFQGEVVPPGTDTEQQLLEIWSEVLNATNFGVKNTFYELGGNSLNAIQILYHVINRFDVQLDLKILFENPDISSLAAEVDRLLWLNESSDIADDEIEMII